jgi:hypothetical protein
MSYIKLGSVFGLLQPTDTPPKPENIGVLKLVKLGLEISR